MFHGKQFNICWDNSFITTNVNLTVAYEKSADHQSRQDSSSGEH